jgi:hypothetical protein
MEETTAVISTYNITEKGRKGWLLLDCAVSYNTMYK